MRTVARLTAVARQVAAALDRPTDPYLMTTVERTYAPDWFDPDYWVNNPSLADRFTGRRLYVFGTGEIHEGALTRGEDDNRYRIGVVVFERHVGDGPASADTTWIDGRVAWVEENVFDFLGDARSPALEDTDLIPFSQEWVTVYSADLLRQLSLFRSEVSMVYRKVEGTSG
jgi:hypothetical protein